MYINTQIFEVKLLSNPNYEELFEVYSKCEVFFALGPDPFASYEMIKADIKNSREENGLYCGIYQNYKLIGIVDFVPSNFEGRREIAFLSLLLISAPYRNIGIGRKVINSIEEKIIKNDEVTTIQSAVQVNNEKGRRFWTSMGYKIISEPILCPDTTIIY